MNVCICDDDETIHERIKFLLKSFYNAETPIDVRDTSSGEELLARYSSGESFDIIFLDVEMGAMNGIQTAEIIRKTDPNAIIIFVSSYSSYVFDAFRFEALHFIVKPIKTSEFEEVFRRAINKYKSTHSTINLKWQNERYTINISDITYIEGYRRHITVHTPDESYEAVGKISDIENELEPLGFIRVHQGFIVNMDRIKRFDANDVILQDNSRIMISVRKHTEALKAYDNYIQKWKW